MGFLDGLLGKKRDEDYDWLELNSPSPPDWEEVATDDNGMVFSIDRFSCFNDGDLVWWKQRVGVPGDRYDYLICAASTAARRVMIPICRTLTDPNQRLAKPDVLKQVTTAAKFTPFGMCLDKAEVWAELCHYSTMPPYVLYAFGIIKDDN